MTIANPFVAPAPASGGFKPADHAGRLVIFTPKAVETGIQTAYGTSEAVRADVVVLDAPTGVEEIPDAMIFPKVLQNQLKPKIGQKVLGRLGQGNAKPGQSAPWIIQEPTDADLQAGINWINQATSSQFAAPAPAAAGTPAGQPPF